MWLPWQGSPRQIPILVGICLFHGHGGTYQVLYISSRQRSYNKQNIPLCQVCLSDMLVDVGIQARQGQELLRFDQIFGFFVEY